MGMMVGVAVGWALAEELETRQRGELTMEIRYHGHSCFELSDGDTRVLIDPFLKPNNPVAVTTAEEVEPTQILITHGHVDHMADAVPVATRTGAPLAAHGRDRQLAASERGVENVSDPNLGGTVSSTAAGRSSCRRFTRTRCRDRTMRRSAPSTAHPVGQAGGLGRERRGHDRLPRGRHLPLRRHGADRTLDPHRHRSAADRRPLHDGPPRRRVAAELTGAKTMIPMHYDTFPPIETDAGAFQADVEADPRRQGRGPRAGRFARGLVG